MGREASSYTEVRITRIWWCLEDVCLWDLTGSGLLFLGRCEETCIHPT